MGRAERIKGQETELRLSVDGTHVETVADAVKSFEFTYELEEKSEGYLGETTDRKDATFKGVTGRITVHLEGGALFDMINARVKKARRVPGFITTKISATTIFRFPGGTERTAFFSDIVLGQVPINMSSREGYVEATLPWTCSDEPELT